VKKSCVHIAQPDGRIIPFDTFNLFYRDDRAELLEKLRAEIIAPRIPEPAHD
jgi:7,8-dihydro-6-hydroxymethylpterin dimethyltransferase